MNKTRTKEMKAYCEYRGGENKLNPEALEDLYEASEEMLEYIVRWIDIKQPKPAGWVAYARGKDVALKGARAIIKAGGRK